MTRSTIALDVDGRGVARLVLDRPEKYNVLSGKMCDELSDAAVRLDADPGVRVVVLTGAERASAPGRPRLDATREGRMAEARRFARMLDALNTLPKPLIGRVNGAAHGGGVGLMAVCDAVVAVAGRSSG
jgi:methylglutaconyl-CoA hydratase